MKHPSLIRWSTPLLIGLALSASAAFGEEREAALALKETLAIERALVSEDRARYQETSAARGRTLARLGQLYLALDDGLMDDQATVEQVSLLVSQIDTAENRRRDQLTLERTLSERILDRLRRIDLLNQRIAALTAGSSRQQGALQGRWEVNMLPIDQGGSFELKQTGTVVTGTYVLEGGFDGSLQGTLVGRKVYLVRIDSKLGRSMEFEGYVSADGKRIRGTWLRYDLESGRPGSGQWTASRL